MYQSQLFGKTRREAPRDEESKNAILLSRGGYIDKTSAGVYSFYPLGWRVMQKIIHIVREEMDRLPHTQEMLMPATHPLELWRESGRLDDFKDVMFRLQDQDSGLGPTHEEIVTDLFRRTVTSYKELPVSVYQIQTKFRNEARPKSGLLRGREFMMKDAYSFDLTEEGLLTYYEEAKKAYAAIYSRCGLQAVLTEASGGSFSKFSHEFQVLSEAGEDTVYLNEDGTLGRNKEIVPDENDPDILAFCGGSIKKANGIEVGNIFPLNLRFSTPMAAAVMTEGGERADVWMGCYGIGISRLMGTVVEVYGQLGDKPRIVWPASLAPFAVHFIDLTPDRQGKAIYTKLKDNLSILYDDRSLTAGEKFADADLIGAPYRLVLSRRSLASGGVELITFASGESKIVPLSDIAPTIFQTA
jgi:prolyl-tRNA synthetase